MEQTAALLLRRYEQIWIALKERGKISVVCPSEMHNRLIKAVFKEKDKDLEGRKKWRMEATRFEQEDRVCFKLRKKVNLLDL
jgi:16S rRNA C1402 N4-methylase RsmH